MVGDGLGSGGRCRFVVSLCNDSALIVYDQKGAYTLMVADPVDSCLLYTSPSPRDRQKSRMPSSA